MVVINLNCVARYFSMRVNRISFKAAIPLTHLVLSLLLVLPAAGYAADVPDLTRVAGVYKGEVFNGDDLDPITTTFTFNSDGRLSADYVVDEESGVYEGTLSNTHIEDANTFTFEWTDKFGEGYVVLEFSDDFHRFDGYWGNRDSDAVHEWYGVRE